MDGIPFEQQELRRRIWWVIYRLDSQLSMTLGRPPLIQLSDVSCGLLGEDREHAHLLSGTVLLLTNHEDISWLSFHIQCTKLTYLVHSVQAAFQRKCSRLLSGNKSKDIYDDPRLLETLAELIGKEMTAIYDWLQNVPPPLCNARKGGGEPFSTNRDTLNLSQFSSPIWLERQRLLLELHYHHFMISILRPFIRFPPVSSSMTPQTDVHNISCLNHAMAITSILNQVLSETDLLRGWSPIFQYQWDAILCTLGYVLANSLSPSTPSARTSLHTAIATLDLARDQFLAAQNAAQVVREVSCQVDGLIDRLQQSLSPRRGAAQNQQPPLPPNTVPIGSLPELSPTLGTTMSSVDMVAGSEAWMHASAILPNSWT